jgi:hypothetical protein
VYGITVAGNQLRLSELKFGVISVVFYFLGFSANDFLRLVFKCYQVWHLNYYM